jgi:ABC-2 type transport system permease protein
LLAVSRRAGPIAFSPRRIAAMVLRHWYLLRRPGRAVRSDLLAGGADADVGLPAALRGGAFQLLRARGGTFIGAVLLWDILFRGQLGFSISFLEEMYARNSAT